LAFPESSETAAASSLRSISIATERASVSTTSRGPQPARSAHTLEQARREAHRLKIARERVAHAGPASP
jgi:hypothetical protein